MSIGLAVLTFVFVLGFFLYLIGELDSEKAYSESLKEFNSKLCEQIQTHLNEIHRLDLLVDSLIRQRDSKGRFTKGRNARSNSD